MWSGRGSTYLGSICDRGMADDGCGRAEAGGARVGPDFWGGGFLRAHGWARLGGRAGARPTLRQRRLCAIGMELGVGGAGDHIGDCIHPGDRAGDPVAGDEDMRRPVAQTSSVGGVWFDN